jgi:UDP-glucose 4-epimerase
VSSKPVGSKPVGPKSHDRAGANKGKARPRERGRTAPAREGASDRPKRALTVAVTGPTGAIGRSVVRALEQDERVDRILGMARRPFDAAAQGWRKTEYRRGDVLDRDAVRDLVEGADVVVHIAFAIVGGREQSRRINIEGSRNVFEATVSADRPGRLVYTSSIAAYGYHADDPSPLTEDVPPRGSPEHYYSAQKAACEALLAEVTAGSSLDVYVLRPCIVAGPDSTLLVGELRWSALTQHVPAPARQLLGMVPGLRPVLPDPGVPIQLVHQDDVASAASAAAMGDGPPGAYNLAAPGEITLTDLARAVGAYTVPVPHALVSVASRVFTLLPWLPPEAEWVHAARQPMVMDTTRARHLLGWKPRYTAAEAAATLRGVTHD